MAHELKDSQPIAGGLTDLSVVFGAPTVSAPRPAPILLSALREIVLSTLHEVATSGDYADLDNRPSLGSAAAMAIEDLFASPTMTGAPTAPTATPGTNTQQLATTAFVAAAIAALLNSAPGALDTLDELAAALGDDANFATTVTTALAGKLAKASNLSDLPSVGTARTNLGLAIGSDVQAYSATLAALAALTTTAAGRTSLEMVAPLQDRLVSWDHSATAFRPMESADIVTLAGPDSSDFLIGYSAEGDLVKIAWSSLPGIGGGISDGATLSTGLTFPVSGLKVLDTNASHALAITVGSDLSANRSLTLTTGDADRTVTISGDATISQDYGTGASPQFLGINVGHATDTTVTRSAAGRIAVEGKNALLLGQTDALTAGYAATPYNAGTKSTGTYTPAESDGNFQYATNNGAHTLAPPTNSCTLIVLYANGASAGTITTSGFTKVTGDSFTTTNGHEFMCYITKHNNGTAFSHLHVTALQ